MYAVEGYEIYCIILVSSTSPVILDGQEHGTLTFDAEWYPVIHPKPGEPLPESSKLHSSFCITLECF